MNGTKDILKFVVELAASTQQRLRFYYTWQRFSGATTSPIKQFRR
jgi:hypothetical protein